MKGLFSWTAGVLRYLFPTCFQLDAIRIVAVLGSEVLSKKMLWKWVQKLQLDCWEQVIRVRDSPCGSESATQHFLKTRASASSSEQLGLFSFGPLSQRACFL